MLDGAFIQETSNIIEDTFSAYNICKGRIFEEINKGTAWALGSEKYIKRRTRDKCSDSLHLVKKWLLPVQQQLFWGGGGGEEEPATFLRGGIEPLLPSERFALLVSDPLFLLFSLFFCIEKDHYFLQEMSFNDLSGRIFLLTLSGSNGIFTSIFPSLLF